MNRYSKTQIEKLDGLLAARKKLQAKLDQIDSEIYAVTHTTESRPSVKRKRLHKNNAIKNAVMPVMQNTKGGVGLAIDEIAERAGVTRHALDGWLYTKSGKRHLERIDRGTYRARGRIK